MGPQGHPDLSVQKLSRQAEGNKPNRCTPYAMHAVPHNVSFLLDYPHYGLDRQHDQTHPPIHVHAPAHSTQPGRVLFSVLAPNP